MKLSGKLSRTFLGGPVWVLKSDDGKQYQLQGKIPGGLDGKSVIVQGQLSDSQFGISMVGDIVEVKSICLAS